MEEEQYFNELRDRLTKIDTHIKKGKMMSSEAITYDGKVFAFFSRKKKMVFKLGKTYLPDEAGFEVDVFNPFTKRPPLYGWFEVPFQNHEQWPILTEEALVLIKKEAK